jgi:hypothetical protein
VHFYSNFWSFKRSNRGAMTQCRADRRLAAPRCRAPRLPRHPRPTRAFSRPPRAFPMTRVPRRLVLRTVSYAPRYGPSVRSPFARSRAPPRRRRRSTGC